ncbi:Major facilitator superfamily domain, general substrate transporter [Phaffia rhodozyma]|uniref:Major facilitator superfamily domain, general substrate transporter n=1 Tax=Phaffia rhodozyma TaxID=264483 RepID=A0A0F7SXQ4_PHARH|nr:Major facilitator superfamily domain, general substrate transporter [Phaffia rhodozyma]
MEVQMIALLYTACFPMGQNWTDSSMGPLKIIGSAGSVANSTWPIIGGVALDWCGPDITTLVCTTGILIGAVVSSVGVTVEIWRILVAGNIIMGLGTAILDSAQHKLFYHWFEASGLAFAFGLESAVAKTVSLVAGMIAVPIKGGTGWYGWSF